MPSVNLVVDLNLCAYPAVGYKEPRRPATIYTGMVATGRMARQPVRTFPPEVWDEFVAALKRGPTPEQARAVERAMEIGSKITLKDSSIVKKKRKISPAGIVRGMNAGACTGKVGQRQDGSA